MTLRRFWTMVAHYHGQTWNAAEFARALGSSEPTARRYLDILTGYYVVRQLVPWFENIGKRQVKSPKVYVRDSGLLHAILGIPDLEVLRGHPKHGASFEGFAVEQLSHLLGGVGPPVPDVSRRTLPRRRARGADIQQAGGEWSRQRPLPTGC